MHLHLQVVLLTLAAAWVEAFPTRPPAQATTPTLPPLPLPPHLQFGAPGMPPRPRKTPGKSNTAGPSGKGSAPAGNDPNFGRGVVNNPEEAIVNAAGSDNWKYDQSNGGFSPPSDWDRTPGASEFGASSAGSSSGSESGTPPATTSAKSGKQGTPQATDAGNQASTSATATPTGPPTASGDSTLTDVLHRLRRQCPSIEISYASGTKCNVLYQVSQTQNEQTHDRFAHN